MGRFEGLSLYEAMEASAKNSPNRFALYYRGKYIYYWQFLRRVNRMADVLTNRLHLKAGDVVLLAQPNIPDTLVLFYAINKIGAVANMVHPFTPYNQLVAIYKKTNSKVAFLFEQRVAKEVDLYKKFVDHVIVTRVEDDLPLFKKMFYHTFMNRKIRKKLSKTYNFQGFTYLKDVKSTGTKVPTHKNGDNCTVLLHSGSTTGEPKTIALRDRNFNFIAEHASEFYCMELEKMKGTGMLSILPSFHGFGLCMTMHCPLTNEFGVMLVPKFSPKVVVKYMKTGKVNCFMGVPNIFERMLKYKPFVKSKYLKNILISWCGGDYLSPQIEERWNEVVAAQGGKSKLFPGYGLTECVAAICVNNYNHYLRNSIGYPLTEVEMVIMSLEDGKVLPPNEIGEICIKSEANMLGYFNDVAATKEALRGGYLHSGDLGYKTEDGFIIYKQRAKRVIKVSGVGVFPGEVEALVATIPGVKGVCAIEIPDPALIHAIKIFVIATYVDEEGMKERIMESCRRYLIRWAVPKEIEFVEALPYTMYGKVNFRILQDEENKKRGIK